MTVCTWVRTLPLLLLVGCVADDLDLAGNAAADSGAATDSGIDAGTRDGGARDGGAPSCCLDQRCTTCPNGFYMIGGCGPEWCGPPLPDSCPAVPSPCPVCANLAETDCPTSWSQNVVGCVQKHCAMPAGDTRYLACVESGGFPDGDPPVEACP